MERNRFLQQKRSALRDSVASDSRAHEKKPATEVIKSNDNASMTDDKNAKKKILFMLPRLYPGGAERVLITLMNNLDRSKFDIYFTSLSGEGTIKHWIDNDIPIHVLNKKRVSTSLVALYKKIREIKPDTVVTTMIQANAGLLLLKPFFPKIRFIVRESSLPVKLIKEYGWKGRICKYVYKFLYPMADLVISPASAITNEFKYDLKIKTGNHKTLYNPVHEERLQATLTPAEHFPNRAKTQRFICVGRLGFEKGYDRLIEALADYKPDNGKNWYLEIVGKGSETKNLSELIKKHGLQRNIKMAGYHNIPWPFMAAADCLLLPSRWEGMPNVALEALACGIPVIAHSDAGGITEISDMCENQSVMVADTMDQFVGYMKGIAPESSAKLNSRLPKEFHLKKVMQEFESFI